MSKASVAGRGVIFLTISKAYFILSGFAIFFILPRILDKRLFGLFSIVNSVVAVLNGALVYGTIQMVSKFVSQEEEKGGAILRSALHLQIAVGGGIFAAYFLAAPYIARFYKDPSLTPYLRLSSLIVICYSFYAIYIGYINGMKRFGLQAGLDMGYSTTKMSFMLCLAAAGLGAAGAVSGFALAAFSLLITAIFVSGARATQGNFGKGILFRFEAFLIVFTFIIYLLFYTDLWLLKRLSSPDLSYVLSAYYAAAQKLALIPYQAIIAITFVLFPYVSRLTFIEDTSKLRDYIHHALRYSLIILIGIAVLFSANARGLLNFIFPAGYEAAAPALSLLVFGMVLFSLLYINTTIISGSGRPGHSFLIALATWIVDVELNLFLIPRFGMAGAALATTLAMLTGLAVSGFYVYRRFGAYLPPSSALRIGIGGAVVAVLSFVVPLGGIFLVVKIPAFALVYLCVLFLTREIGQGDIRRLTAVFRGG